MRESALLAVDRVSKSFGRTAALKAVSFDLRAGEVHVLAGENGAGKSTLIKILSGVYTDFEGELRLEGRPVRFRTPVEALREGIATIHQELSLVSSLSVSDNFLLAMGARPFVPSKRKALEDARAGLAAVGLALDPEMPVEALTLGDRQLVEIARALAQAARLLVMDEPTSTLSEPEVERLFERIDALRARGVGVLYISHRMEEIYRLADRITVLRDGERRLTENRRDLSRSELVRAMVGKELAKQPAERAPSSAPALTLLSVRGLGSHAPSALSELSFELRPGEVLGLAGLQGSGSSEALHALFGSSRPRAERSSSAASRTRRKRRATLLPAGSPCSRTIARSACSPSFR